MGEQFAGAQDPNQQPRREAGYRFEATVHPGDEARDLERVADLDLDRIPDPEGQVRLLLTMDDCVRLLEQGYEVRLLRLLPVRPLDARLVESDESARDWLEEQVKGLERAEGS
jgi:hypothetical protein